MRQPFLHTFIPRPLLGILSRFYLLGVQIRLVLYRTGYFKSRRLQSTTISIGNITVGGTGKTPMVEYLAQYLQQRSYSVAILTRGYGRQNAKERQIVSDGKKILNDVGHTGDEALMLALHLPGVVVIADKNRFAAGQWAETTFPIDIHILDDGFQHLALERDINLLVMDIQEAVSDQQMLPLGRLREPLSEITRADALIITGADRLFDQPHLEARLQLLGGKKPIFYAYREIIALNNPITGESKRAQQLIDRPIAMICGIGRPDRFVEDLNHFRAQVISQHIFPDHYWFSQEEIEHIYKKTRESGVDWLLTTEKDWMRLRRLELPNDPTLLIVQSEIRVVDQARFLSFIVRNLGREATKRPPPS